MDEEFLIQQVGLILMQTRFARRALEDVERNTARYGGISFTNALAAGPRFGEPPLLNGALKVHVVNISDLNPGTGIGGLIEGVLGGIGRFFGGFLGGAIGGIISGASLPFLVSPTRKIVENIRLITADIHAITNTIDRIFGTPVGNEGETGNSSGGGTDLNQWTATINALTNLFNAASSGPGQGGQTEGEVPEHWLVTLHVTQRLVASLSHMVDGLILLVPMLVGALAYLIARLDDIKLKILDLLQFAVRNLFLLRGVVLVTVYDTLAGIARLGASLVRDVGTAITSILASLFDAIGAVLNLALETLRFLGNGLQQTMNGLLEWLRTGLGTFLIELGRTDIFRLLHHLVRTLPLILPALVVLKHNRELSDGDRQALRDAATIQLPSGQLQGGMPAFTPFPNLAELMAPAPAVSALQTTLVDARNTVTTSVTDSFSAAQRGLEDIQRSLTRESRSASGLFARDDDPRLVALRQRAGELASTLQPAIDAARDQPETGLEAIAGAYEQWLTGGGLQTVLNSLTQHFQQTPVSGTASERSIAGRIVAASTGVEEPPTATIRIERVEIEVVPPETTTDAQDGTTSSFQQLEHHLLEPEFVERFQERLTRYGRDWELRGGDPRFISTYSTAGS